MKIKHGWFTEYLGIPDYHWQISLCDFVEKIFSRIIWPLVWISLFLALTIFCNICLVKAVGGAPDPRGVLAMAGVLGIFCDIVWVFLALPLLWDVFQWAKKKWPNILCPTIQIERVDKRKSL